MSDIKVEKRVVVETVEVVKLGASEVKDAIMEYLVKRGVEQFNREHIAINADSKGFQSILLSKRTKGPEQVAQ